MTLRSLEYTDFRKDYTNFSLNFKGFLIFGIAPLSVESDIILISAN